MNPAALRPKWASRSNAPEQSTTKPGHSDAQLRESRTVGAGEPARAKPIPMTPWGIQASNQATARHHQVSQVRGARNARAVKTRPKATHMNPKETAQALT